MIFFAIFSLAVLFLILSFALPCWARLALAVSLSVLQMYLPGVMIGAYPPPLALLTGLLLWPEFLKGLKFTPAWAPTKILIAIGTAYTVSLMWSIDLQSGVRALVYLWLFLAIFSAAVIEGRRNHRRVINLLACTVILAAVAAATIILFRVLPIIKLGYLQSSLASLFINRNVLELLFTTAQNNVLDPTKSGGMLFVNANVAGAYMGVMAFAGIGIFRLRGSKLALGASICCLTAIFFTGSKAAIILAILGASSTMVLLVKTDANRRGRVKNWVFIICTINVVLLAWLLFFSGMMSISSSGVRAFAGDSDATLAVRQQIWGYAAIEFFHHPLLGQGFGGWQKGFAGYARYVGVQEGYPPHNTIIYLWSQGGLVAAALGLLFIFCVLSFAKRRLKIDAVNRLFGIVLAMSGAFGWVFIHGMGENFGLLGDEHMEPVLAVLLALAYLQRNENMLNYVLAKD